MLKGTSNTESLVRVQNLQVTNREGRILSSASVEIVKGSSLAFFGPGGSGKSLLLKFIFGNRLADLQYMVDSFFAKKGLTYYLDRNNDQKEPAEIPTEDYDLYLIDEPENGFTIERFADFHQQIKSRGGTLIFVTHNLEFLQGYADEVLVLKYGECKGVFTKESFFNNTDPYIDYLSKMGC